jgi:negative regulator of genetic competence, sporulation and motility
MKVEMLDEKSIKITLKEFELIKRNVDIHSLLRSKNDEKIMEVFRDILTDVDEQYGYSFADCPGVYMEARVNLENDCELVVKKYEMNKKKTAKEIKSYSDFKEAMLNALAGVSEMQLEPLKQIKITGFRGKVNKKKTKSKSKLKVKSKSIKNKKIKEPEKEKPQKMLWQFKTFDDFSDCMQFIKK